MIIVIYPKATFWGHASQAENQKLIYIHCVFNESLQSL